MIDYFALTLIHGLLAIGLFRLVQNDALDPEKPPVRAERDQSEAGPIEGAKSRPLPANEKGNRS